MSELLVRAAKKERIIDILHGQTPASDTPVINNPYLSKLAVLESAPKSSANSTVACLLVTICFLLAVLVVLCAAYVLSIELARLMVFAVPSLAIFLVALSSLVWLRSRAESRSAFTKALEPPVQELINMRDFLSRNLQSISERTSKYFHCMTNTKITSNFVLMQIESALNSKITEVACLINTNKRASLLKAFELLRGTIIFHDGVILGTGQTHIVPLARLRDTIVLLMDELERGVTEMEGDIASCKQRYEQ
jgi:ABC-type multidrug transport system fused ATPase/permease subunit